MAHIMIIRHAEKPGGNGGDLGVTLDGRSDERDLSVRGWQRAGALVRFFHPRDGRARAPGIRVPAALFAAAGDDQKKSLRPLDTIGPLAEDLGLTVDTTYSDRSLEAAARAIRDAPEPVLISWRHEGIPKLTAAIAGHPIGPASWPINRFDLVWVLSDVSGDWQFVQVHQMLLAGDLDRDA